MRIPSSVNRIEYGAFFGCKSLISLELPEGLKTTTLRRSKSSCSSCGDGCYSSTSSTTSPLFNMDGCSSMVNWTIPLNQEVPIVTKNSIQERRVLESVMFGRIVQQNGRTVVDGHEDLIYKLKHRFDDLPLHKLCYYQSYYPTLTEAMQELRRTLLSTVSSDPSNDSKNSCCCTNKVVDAFGMTPLHILALSQTPNVPMLLALMNGGGAAGGEGGGASSRDLVDAKDSFGYTPMEYLCRNRSPGISRVIRLLLRKSVWDRVRWIGLQRWKSNVMQCLDKTLMTMTAKDHQQQCWRSSLPREISTLTFKLATYERLEILSLLELFLWKAAMNVCNNDNDEEANNAKNRQCSRICCGASVVIPNVLPFLLDY
eukprot:scaffold609_cov130-Cylindrotheca_fusiformis.AAC.17